MLDTRCVSSPIPDDMPSGPSHWVFHGTCHSQNMDISLHAFETIPRGCGDRNPHDLMLSGDSIYFYHENSSPFVNLVA